MYFFLRCPLLLPWRHLGKWGSSCLWIPAAWFSIDVNLACKTSGLASGVEWAHQYKWLTIGVIHFAIIPDLSDMLALHRSFFKPIKLKNYQMTIDLNDHCVIVYVNTRIVKLYIDNLYCKNQVKSYFLLCARYQTDVKCVDSVSLCAGSHKSHACIFGSGHVCLRQI